MDNVALRKESVDRNLDFKPALTAVCMSLSARRAWIEIVLGYKDTVNALKSLSARRAWIEIPKSREGFESVVSLSARRAWIEINF